MEAHIGTGRPPYGTWRAQIDRCHDIEGLLAAVRQYLGLWSPEALAQLPPDLAGIALPARGALHARAFLASQAELGMKVDDPRHPALRDMALVMAAAAARLQVLESYESVLRARNATLATQGTSYDRLEAEVRRK